MPGENPSESRPAEARAGTSSSRPGRMPRLAAPLAVLATAGGLAWYGWRWYAAPAPPDIPLAGAEPAVVRAIEAARTAVRRDPYSATSWAALGKILRASGLPNPATECFGQAARLDGENPRWPYLRGEALLLQGETAAGLEPLRRAAELCRRQGQEIIAPHLRLAEALLTAGAHAEAEHALGHAAKVAPGHPSIDLNRGYLAYAHGDLPASRVHLLRCRHSPFTQKRAEAQLAAVCRRLGDEAAAEEHGRRAAALPEDHHWGDPWLLECLQAGVGRPARFRYVEHLEAQGRFQEAVAALQEMAADGPDYRVQVGLGKNLARTGDLAGAEQALRIALHLAPGSVQANYLLAKVLWGRAEPALRAGRRNEALPLLRAAADCCWQVLKSKPDHAPALTVLGLCLEQLGDRKGALAALREAVEYGPENAEPSLRLGECLARAGRTAEARVYLESARRLAGPDDPRPQAALERLGHDKQ